MAVVIVAALLLPCLTSYIGSVHLHHSTTRSRAPLITAQHRGGWDRDGDYDSGRGGGSYRDRQRNDRFDGGYGGGGGGYGGGRGGGRGGGSGGGRGGRGRNFDRQQSGGGYNGMGGGGGSRNSPYVRREGDYADVDVAAVERLIEERTQLRREHNFQEADALRNQLTEEHGVMCWDDDSAHKPITTTAHLSHASV